MTENSDKNSYLLDKIKETEAGTTLIGTPTSTLNNETYIQSSSLVPIPTISLNLTAPSSLTLESLNTTEPKQSKRALKKKIAWDKRKLKWKAKKELNKQRKKESIQRGEVFHIRKKRKPPIIESDIEYCGNLVIDAGYDDMMQCQEVNKLKSQIILSYGINNKRYKRQFHFHVCGLNGQLQEKFKIITGVENWKASIHHRSYLEVFEKDRIVYLTAESPNILESIDSEKVYIVGGLVDHNRYKGFIHNSVVSKQIATARLPIEENIKMDTRKVLTIVHVVEILLEYLKTGSWKESLLSKIPSRKGAIPKPSCPEISSSEDLNTDDSILHLDKQENQEPSSH